MSSPFDAEVLARGAKLLALRKVGSGELCSGCSKTIEAGDGEYEVTVQSDIVRSVLRFHVRCYAIWSGERVE